MNTPLTHAGGVVFRSDHDDFLYLVVSSSDGLNWVLPKGHIEPGESPEAAAVREIAEEAGVVGEVVQILSIKPFIKLGKSGVVQYFLIREIGAIETKENRQLLWKDEKEALELLTFSEAKAVLLEGAAAIKRLG
nr:NUDIX domain protein [uncultured bacterium]